MEAHEVYEIDYLTGRMYYVEAVPLCHGCHCFIHYGRMENLVASGKLSTVKMREVLEHGNRVLQAVGLVKPLPYNGPSVEWNDWRLVIEGREYEPRFKNLRELEKYYAADKDGGSGEG